MHSTRRNLHPRTLFSPFSPVPYRIVMGEKRQHDRTNMIIRRKFIKSVASLAGGIVAASPSGCVGILSNACKKKSDIRIENISFGYDEYLYRAPVGFAGAVMDRATLITVRCSVRTAGGKLASGFGSIPFNHTFSFPSKKLTNEAKNDAMKALATELAK